MGRILQDVERAILAKSSDVAGITPQHIFLKNGEVIDPQEYDKTRVVGFRFSYLVLKLTRCAQYCGNHVSQTGRHIIAEFPHAVSPFGNYHHQRWVLPKEYCSLTHWDIEEDLSKEEAEKYGIFTKTKIVKAILADTGLIYLK